MVMYVQASSDPTERKRAVLSTLFDGKSNTKNEPMAPKPLTRMSSEKQNGGACCEYLENASYPKSPSTPLVHSIDTFTLASPSALTPLKLPEHGDAVNLALLNLNAEKWKDPSRTESVDSCFACNPPSPKTSSNATSEMRAPSKERKKSPKPSTIHSEVQNGDVRALRIRLQEAPGSINLRNPIMSQTPLHVAVASNQIEVVRFLLEWKGPELPNIEAQNMYGETALHLGSKNGYSQIVRMLLQNGAKINVQAMNGMTPLHLAVWHCIKGEDTSVVETLLEYDADASIQDKEEKTPIDHLSKVCGNQKLHTILQSHLKKQIAAKAKAALNSAKDKMGFLEKELSQLVGLDELKDQIRKWGKGMLLDQKRRALGLQTQPRQPPHMAFLGNPGTGKTTVARLMAKLLHMVGVLPTTKVVEVQRTDLVGEFVGHTGVKTRKKIEEAMGGILFVDETYRLMPILKEDEKDYGAEALEEIMSVMDNGKLVVIFAGYEVPMQRVFEVNPGFRRRISKCFTFPDLSPFEIAQVIKLKMEDQDENSPLYGFRLSEECSCEAMSQLLVGNTCEGQRRRHNGGLALPLLLDARDQLDFRLDLDCCDPNALITINMQDMEAAIKMIY